MWRSASRKPSAWFSIAKRSSSTSCAIDGSSRMEFDHCFICVPPGAREAELLMEFGLREGTANRHSGQGTANRRFFFNNAYLELLYEVDASELQDSLTAPTRLSERLAADSDRISPFGFGFRPAGDETGHAPFPSWTYRSHYLPAQQRIDVGTAPVAEPMWFFLSFGIRPDQSPAGAQQPLQHPCGFQEISTVTVTVAHSQTWSRPAQCVGSTAGIELVAGSRPLLQIGFDRQRAGRCHDFRPALPLVFRW